MVGYHRSNMNPPFPVLGTGDTGHGMRGLVFDEGRDNSFDN